CELFVAAKIEIGRVEPEVKDAAGLLRAPQPSAQLGTRDCWQHEPTRAVAPHQQHRFSDVVSSPNRSALAHCGGTGRSLSTRLAAWPARLPRCRRMASTQPTSAALKTLRPISLRRSRSPAAPRGNTNDSNASPGAPWMALANSRSARASAAPA